jgi:hypothetical protein
MKKYFLLGRLNQPSQDGKLLYMHDKLNEPTTAGPLSFVLFESPIYLSFNHQQGLPLYCIVSLLLHIFPTDYF